MSNFEGGNQNRLGGYFSGFADAASSSGVSIAKDAEGVRSLEVLCNRAPDGYCGVWIHAFDFTQLPQDRWYLDASQFKYISFWIRGDEGAQVDLRVADAEWERREDTLPVGSVAEFLPAGQITADWQHALVPMERLPQRFDLTLLASFVFQSSSPGTATFSLAGLALLEREDAFVPRPKAVDKPSSDSCRHKSTWVWNTADLLVDPALAGRLVDLLVSQGFDRVYLQLPDGDSKASQMGEMFIDAEAIRPLVASFTTRGIRVFALDGFARYALPEYHDGVLRTVDRVIAYNESVDEAERFYGIRYDIEPYLLPGFHGPGRESILSGFLDLISKMGDRAQAAGLVFGADIPFWYDSRSEYDGEPVTSEYRGKRRPVSHHIIDIVDEIAVMAYRTTAFGADGVIRHSADELAYANAVGKDVYVAVETHPLPDEEIVDVNGPPRVGIPPRVEGRGTLFAIASADSVKLVLADPGSDARLGLLKIMADSGTDESSVLWWPVSRRTPVPGAKLSFATLGAGRLQQVIEQALPELMSQPSFAGFAIHHAGSLSELLASSAAQVAEEPVESGTN